MDHAARVGERQNNAELCYAGLKKEDFLTSRMHKRDLILLNLILKECDRFMWTRIRISGGSCVYDNEHAISGSHRRVAEDSSLMGC